jgi:ribonuclease-3
LAPAHYVVTNETGPEHRKVFHVELSIGDKKLAVATGLTKKSAETQAAQIALAKLKDRKKSSPAASAKPTADPPKT